MDYTYTVDCTGRLIAELKNVDRFQVRGVTEVPDEDYDLVTHLVFT